VCTHVKHKHTYECHVHTYIATHVNNFDDIFFYGKKHFSLNHQVHVHVHVDEHANLQMLWCVGESDFVKKKKHLHHGIQQSGFDDLITINLIHF